MVKTRTLAASDRSEEAQRAVVNMLRVADQVRRRLAETIEPRGITGQQYNVLRILRGAHPRPLATLEIGRRVLERTPGITRLLDRLERKGLVERRRHDRDRRQVLCSITDDGLELVRSLDEPVRDANVEALRTLDRDELRRLSELLERVQERVPSGGA